MSIPRVSVDPWRIVSRRIGKFVDMDGAFATRRASDPGSTRWIEDAGKVRLASDAGASIAVGSGLLRVPTTADADDMEPVRRPGTLSVPDTADAAEMVPLSAPLPTLASVCHIGGDGYQLASLLSS
jgi:hypothetical protein